MTLIAQRSSRKGVELASLKNKWPEERCRSLTILHRGIKYDLISYESVRSFNGSFSKLRRSRVKINVGSLDKEDIYNAFYNPQTRRLIKVTEDNIDYGMSLVEDINQRKKLLIDEGIITNPFNLPD